MATQIRGNKQIMDATVNLAKLENNFIGANTWNVDTGNSAVITGLGTPSADADAASKGYVDGLVASTSKGPDGYAPTVAGDYPSTYKGEAIVEGDPFYITDITNGTLVGARTVNVGDMLVALVDAPGIQVDTDWIIVESNRADASEVSQGVIRIATQAEVGTGTNDLAAVTPLKLSTYIDDNNLDLTAGTGLLQSGKSFNVVAADNSLAVNADDIGVRVGSAAMEITTNGVELKSSISGARTFTGAFIASDSVVLGTNTNDASLAAGPDGTVNLAIATTGYVDAEIAAIPVSITPGDGMVKTGTDLDIVSINNGILINTDDIELNLGSTNGGTSIEITATGVELAATIAGARTFSAAVTVQGALSANSGSTLGGGVTITGGLTSSGSVLLGTNVNDTTLAITPDGTVPLAISSVKYVDDQIALIPVADTEVYNELPAVTAASADVSLINTPTAGTLRVYLNGIRQIPGGSNDYTTSGTTVTFADPLSTGDVVVVDYLY